MLLDDNESYLYIPPSDLSNTTHFKFGSSQRPLSTSGMARRTVVPTSASPNLLLDFSSILSACSPVFLFAPPRSSSIISWLKQSWQSSWRVQVGQITASHIRHWLATWSSGSRVLQWKCKKIHSKVSLVVSILLKNHTWRNTQQNNMKEKEWRNHLYMKYFLAKTLWVHDVCIHK